MNPKSRLLAILSTVLVAQFAPPAGAQQKLVPYSAEYKVHISIASGRLTTRLNLTENGYEAVHEIVPTGLAKWLKNGVISETSRFESNGSDVSPYWYKSVDTLSSDKTSAEVSFDWDANRLSGKVNDEDVVIDLADIVYDRVSIQYELMQDLLNGEAGERYVLFDIDEFKTLIVRNIGEKRVETPAGDFDVVGIQHQAEHSSRVTTLWCAEKLGYLPVMIEQHRKGKLNMRAELKEYSLLPSPERSAQRD